MYYIEIQISMHLLDSFLIFVKKLFFWQEELDLPQLDKNAPYDHRPLFTVLLQFDKGCLNSVVVPFKNNMNRNIHC